MDSGHGLKLCVHGLAVELRCAVPSLAAAMEAAIWPFVEPELPESFVPVSGILRPFEEAEVLRHLSPGATRCTAPGAWLELYQDGQRFWLVDDRWGMCEINLMRGTWRSWVLPGSTLAANRIVEGAVLWPLAQLLRPRGLQLVPAASVARSESGVLILASSPIGAELSYLLADGWKLVGQRWTAVRPDGDAIDLLDMPGWVERGEAPRRRPARPTAVTPDGAVDLSTEFLGAGQRHAFCDTVLLIEPGRRGRGRFVDLSKAEAHEAIRRAWPIVDIHPSRRGESLPARLVERCRCAQVHLSNDPADLAATLDALRVIAPAGAILPSLDLTRNDGARDVHPGLLSAR